MRIEKLSPEQWKTFSENAHAIAFGKNKPQEQERITYALLCLDPERHKLPLGYLTAIEMDKDTVYWQFGGVFPNVKGTVRSFIGYTKFCEWASRRYKRVITYVENTNTDMLRLALKAGFFVMGVKYSQGSILVQLTLEFDNGS